MLSSLCSWRRMRRAAHEALTKRAVQNYHHIQTKEATILASSLLSPCDGLGLEKQFHRLAASIILSIVYDYPTLESIDDPMLEKVEAYNLRVGHAMTPGSFYVVIFPWMMYIPERSWIYRIVSRCTLTHDIKQGSRSGSGKALNNLPGIEGCSRAFSIASGLTSCVVTLSAAS